LSAPRANLSRPPSVSLTSITKLIAGLPPVAPQKFRGLLVTSFGSQVERGFRLFPKLGWTDSQPITLGQHGINSRSRAVKSAYVDRRPFSDEHLEYMQMAVMRGIMKRSPSFGILPVGNSALLEVMFYQFNIAGCGGVENRIKMSDLKFLRARMTRLLVGSEHKCFAELRLILERLANMRLRETFQRILTIEHDTGSCL
jgi:hypothetical protein